MAQHDNQYSHTDSSYQQTRNIHSILVWCWASVTNGGPALNQHGAVSVFSGTVSPRCAFQRTNVDLILGQRRRRCTNISSELDQCIIFDGLYVVTDISIRRSVNTSEYILTYDFMCITSRPRNICGPIHVFNEVVLH